jgi:hypothetical protein
MLVSGAFLRIDRFPKFILIPPGLHEQKIEIRAAPVKDHETQISQLRQIRRMYIRRRESHAQAT